MFGYSYLFLAGMMCLATAGLTLFWCIFCDLSNMLHRTRREAEEMREIHRNAMNLIIHEIVNAEYSWQIITLKQKLNYAIKQYRVYC